MENNKKPVDLVAQLAANIKTLAQEYKKIHAQKFAEFGIQETSLLDKMTQVASSVAEDIGKKVATLQQELHALYLQIKALDA